VKRTSLNLQHVLWCGGSTHEHFPSVRFRRLSGEFRQAIPEKDYFPHWVGLQTHESRAQNGHVVIESTIAFLWWYVHGVCIAPIANCRPDTNAPIVVRQGYAGVKLCSFRLDWRMQGALAKSFLAYSLG
jgi:hypothetical protein